MDFSLAILNYPWPEYLPTDPTIDGALLSLSHDVDPVIRAGTIEVPGPSAQEYSNFILELEEAIHNSGLPGYAYVIIGPNEPVLEPWIERDCYYPNSGPSGSPTPPPSGSCGNASGPYCSPENLEYPYCLGDSIGADEASTVCLRESGGNPNVINDNCLSGTSYDYSVGLFQINLVPFPQYDGDDNLIGLSEGRCPGAFSLDHENPQAQPPNCDVINQETLDECVANLREPDYNREEMARISTNCTNFLAWRTVHDECNLRPYD
jgi:hypothetical protein